MYFFRAVRYGYKSQLVNIHRTSKSSVFTQKDYLAQVLEPYIESFLNAFRAILRASKTL